MGIKLQNDQTQITYNDCEIDENNGFYYYKLSIHALNCPRPRLVFRFEHYSRTFVIMSIL